MRIYLCDESAKERSAIKKCVDKYLRGNYQVSIKEFSSVENMLSELPINKPSLMIVNLPEQKIKDPVIVQKLQGRKSNQKMIMTAAIGFLMIIAIVALLLKGKMSPIVVLAVIPVIAALILVR